MRAAAAAAAESAAVETAASDLRYCRGGTDKCLLGFDRFYHIPASNVQEFY